MLQAHITISGYVQGIGFRQFIKSKARQLGITGWVRNTPEGKVEAVLQGDKEKIEQLILLCKKGPFLAEVKKVEMLWEEGRAFTEFLIG